MKLPIVRWKELSREARKFTLERPVSQKNENLTRSVSAILQKVKGGGDAAVIELTQKYDQCLLQNLRVSTLEIETAIASLSPSIIADLQEAIRRISLFHKAQLPKSIDLETSPGVRCERRFLPIRRVGLYIPGGTAPLPSTVMMLGVPSLIAGCTTRVLLTPPRKDGSIDPHILAAASLLGITEIFKAGGAQAIAALAYGTESIPKVDKIFGPGNSWVTEAKIQVAQDPLGAACDMPAGPSEVMVIADQSANPAFIAADLLSQAEHGEDSQVVLLCNSRTILEEVLSELTKQVAKLPRQEIALKALENSALIEIESIEEALDICNDYAPEHLILQVTNPRKFAEGVVNAGSVFLGAYTPESVGDYASGTNHVLPTYGFARAYSGLTTESFLKSISFQELTQKGLAELGPVVVRLAGAEGLEAHANAVKIRLEQR